MRCLLCTGLVVALSSLYTCSVEATAEEPYRAERSEPVVHEVDFSVVVTPPYQCKVLKVWLPAPQSDFAQEISDSRFETFPQNVAAQVAAEPTYGNRFAYFEFHEPQGAQIIRHRFKAKVWNLHWNVEPARIAIAPREGWSGAFARYLKPQTITDSKAFDEVLREIASRPNGDAERIFGVMGWIDKNLTYDHARASLRADANHAFSTRCGHCSDYHGLCATMGRALGFPTRVTYGLSLFPKNSPSHCRMEAYLPPYGWVSFDLSETQQMVKRINSNPALGADQKLHLAEAARDRLRRGFRENCWLLLTKGTDYELAPKASRPVSIVRTAYIEADGEPLPEPDPANAKVKEFAWMTVHHYKADRVFRLPFADVSTLQPDFKPLFNGKDLTGWKQYQTTNPTWKVEGDKIVCADRGGGWLGTERDYDDFELQLQYRLTPGGNSGIYIRAPETGHISRVGMEIQILDDDHPRYAKLQNYQYTGSIYHVVGPAKKASKPAGEWNDLTIIAKGRQVRVAVNGQQVVDANLDDYLKTPAIAKEHTGLARAGGRIGLQSHTDRVEFRNLRIRELK